MARKCELRKKNGEGCGADAQTGNSVCVFHDPARALESHRARQAGGITRSRPVVLPGGTPDYPMGNTRDVSEFLAVSINQLRRGELDPRVANAVGYLSSILLRSLEQGPFEERLAKIEAALAENAPQMKGT